MPLAIDGMKPDTPAIEDQARDICESARANASTLRQMDVVPNLALQPLLFVNIDGNRGVSAFGDAAAATGIAIRKVGAVLHDIEGAAIGSNDALTVRCWHDYISSEGLL